jgi:hypothetical protein
MGQGSQMSQNSQVIPAKDVNVLYNLLSFLT